MHNPLWAIKEIKMTIRIVILLLSIFLGKEVNASTWVPVTNVQLVHSSDLIIQGEIFKKGHDFYIETNRIIQGKKLEEVKLITPNSFLDGITLREKQKGIFFLRKKNDEDVYKFFHPSCVKKEKNLEVILEAINIWNKPEKYIADFEKEDADVIYVIGQLFSGWRVHSREVEFLTKSMRNYYIEIYEEAPWEVNKRITLTVSKVENSNLLIESSNPNSSLSTVFAKRVKIACQWKYNQKKLPNKFSVTIDNTKINLPDISYQQATTYLIDKLKSKNEGVLLSAIHALSIIGDTSCIPDLVRLLKYPSPRVSEKVVMSLGWSKSSSAIDSIGKILIDYPNYSAAAKALRNINRPACVPYLEVAAKDGGQSAIYALGTMGGIKSTNILLQSIKSSPQKCYYAVNALYWLVRRSNYNVQNWMIRPNPDNADKMIKRIPLWVEWNKKLKADFKIIRTFEEVIKEK